MRKFLIVLLATTLVLGMIGGVFAYFSDAETSAGNAFQAGTLDLRISDNDELMDGSVLGFNGVSLTWSMTNMIPGVTTCPLGTVTLYNTTSMAADHVEISFSHVIDDTPDIESDTDWSSSPADMAKWIEIVSMGYNGGGDFADLFDSDLATYDSNGNTFFDLEDVTLAPWAGEGGVLDNLTPPPPSYGGSKSFQLNLKFNAGATDDIQGDTLITTVHFTLNQHSSQ